MELPSLEKIALDTQKYRVFPFKHWTYSISVWTLMMTTSDIVVKVYSHIYISICVGL